MSLQELYKDPAFAGSFSGKKRFYDHAKIVKPNLSYNKVEKDLASVDTYTLHKPVQKPKLYRRIITKGINELYQADLVDMSKHARVNNGYKWILNIIDTFSKKAWSFKLKNKGAQSVYNVMEPFLRANPCKLIEFDRGKEFYNSKVLNLLKRLKIKHYSTHSDKKCAIVERFNRTLKTRMYKRFTAQGGYRWVDSLQDLVTGYNNSKHRSIGMAPNEVNESNENEVRKKLFPKIKAEVKHKKVTFKVGDTVRISRKKTTFQKGYEQTFSHEVFTISTINETYPITYKIKDYKGEEIEGSFYKNEIQIVDTSENIWPIDKIVKSRKVRGRTEYLVSFKGYPPECNEWIAQQDLFSYAG